MALAQLENVYELIVIGVESSTVTEVKLLQPANALPMLVTLLGMVMEVRSVQPANALLYMDVTLLGMMMEVRPVQPKKATKPMDVTPSGIIVFMQPLINVFVAVSIMALQLFLESYVVLLLSTIMDVRPLQP